MKHRSQLDKIRNLEMVMARVGSTSIKNKSVQRYLVRQSKSLILAFQNLLVKNTLLDLLSLISFSGKLFYPKIYIYIDIYGDIFKFRGFVLILLEICCKNEHFKNVNIIKKNKDFCKLKNIFNVWSLSIA